MTPTEYQNIYQQVMDDVMKNVIQLNTAKADVITNNEMKQFYKDVTFSTEHEMFFYMMLNMPSTMFELKTVKYDLWSKYNSILIEVWKYGWEQQPGSLFQTEAKWWVHQLIQQDGTSIYHMVEVEHLKRYYEAIKDDQTLFQFCPSFETGEAGWCMKLNLLNPNYFELDVIKHERDLYKRKYEQLLNELR